jgi:hypothetical protein
MTEVGQHVDKLRGDVQLHRLFDRPPPTHKLDKIRYLERLAFILSHLYPFRDAELKAMIHESKRLSPFDEQGLFSTTKQLSKRVESLKPLSDIHPLFQVSDLMQVVDSYYRFVCPIKQFHR